MRMRGEKEILVLPEALAEDRYHQLLKKSSLYQETLNDMPQILTSECLRPI